MNIIFLADPNSPCSIAGVAFIINKKRITLKQCVIHELIPGRALFLKIKWHESETTSLVNIYAPTHKPSHPSFWMKLQEEHSALQLPNPDFLLGDFNVTEDPIDWAPVHPDDQAAVTALRELRLAWNLEDTWHHLHPRECAYTYQATTNGQQIQSRLDHIYITKHLSPLTFNWKHKPLPVPTDHWLVKV